MLLVAVQDADGRPALGREAAHSVRRVLHAGDATGREISRMLWARASSLPSVTTMNHALVTELNAGAPQPAPGGTKPSSSSNSTGCSAA